MPADYAYLPSVGNVTQILDKMQTAGTPSRFTHDFLKSNLGFTSSNDRAIIKVLRQLGFLTSDGSPTARYNQFRSATSSGTAMAAGLREGWHDVFLSDERAYEKPASELTQIFKSVAGVGDSVAAKMATTFKALAGKADFTSTSPAAPTVQAPEREENEQTSTAKGVETEAPKLRLHQDIRLHLPPTSDVSVYTGIFRAMRAEPFD